LSKVRVFIAIICVLLFYGMFITVASAVGPPEIEWERALGGIGNDDGNGISPTEDGGYILVGGTFSSDGDVSGNHGSNDAWVVKLTSAGTIVWQKCLGGSEDDYGADISPTEDGGYILVGGTSSSDGDVSGNHGSDDVWVVKLTSAGTIVWQKCLGGSEDDYGADISPTEDGGYILAGGTSSSDGDVSGNHGSDDIWVVKLTAAGTIAWQKCLGGSEDEKVGRISQTDDGGFILVGYTSSSDGDVSGNHGSNDAWVVKLTSAGSIAWQKCLGGSYPETGQSVSQTEDGGYILVGSALSSLNYGDVWVVKLTPAGTITWENSFGGSYFEIGQSISQTEDGGYILIGYTSSSDGDVSGNHEYGYADVWVVKLTPAGTIAWQKCLGGSWGDTGQSISQTEDGGYILVGSALSLDGDVSGNHGSWDAWVVKLAPGSLINEPLVAEFTANPIFGTAPLEVQLTDQSSGSPIIWEWDVDGDSIIDYFTANPTHVYTDPGLYSIALTIHNTTSQNSITKTGYVNVQTPQTIKLQIFSSQDTKVRDGEWPFYVVVSGTPNTEYYIWIKNTGNMTGNYGDMPPILAEGQDMVTFDPLYGPYTIGSYQYMDGGGTNIRDDVPPEPFDGTHYYGKITLPDNHGNYINFLTSTATKEGKYTIRVERKDGTEYEWDECDILIQKGTMDFISAEFQPGTSFLNLHGTNCDNTSTYLFLKGTNLNENGVKLEDIGKISQSWDESSFTVVPVESDNTWNYSWDMSSLLNSATFIPGEYTIYAVSEPKNFGNLDDAVFDTLVVTLPNTTNDSDDLNRLLWHLNHDFLDASHHAFHFYDEFYDYDNNAAPPDPIKENVTELDDQDIWMCYLFPFELNFMTGDRLRCGIDADSWHSGVNPSGESKLEFGVNLVEYLPKETPDEFIGLMHYFEVGVNGNGAPIYASTMHYDDFDNRAEIILKPEIEAYQSGLTNMYASGNVDIYYIPTSDKLIVSRDISQIDAGADINLFKYSTVLNSSFLFFDLTCKPEFDAYMSLRGGFKMADSSAAIPVDAVVPGVKVENKVSGPVSLVINDTSIFDSPPTIEGEITTAEVPSVILEGALATHDFAPGESVKSPFEMDVTYRNLKANSPVLRIKSDEITLHAEGTITYDPKDFLISIPEMEQQFEFDMPFIAEYNEVLGNTEITVHSPVNLHVYDSQGRHVGGTGTASVAEIPNSSYSEEDGAKTILMPSLVKDYMVFIEGTGTGAYNLTLEQPILIQTDSEIIIAFLDIDLRNVATTPGDRDYIIICTSDLISQIQSRMDAGQDFDTAVHGVIEMLDFDQDGVSDTADTNLVFSKAQPMIISGNYNGQPLEQIQLEARLMDLNQPVVGKTIAYSIGDIMVGNAVTDTDGYGMLDYTIPDTIPGNSPVQITFTGDNEYLAVYRNTTLTISNGPPNVELTIPGNYAEVGEWVEIDGSIDDAGITNVTIKIDNQIVSTTIPFQWNTSLYSNGFHVVELTAEDSFGASGSDYVAVIVNNTQNNPIISNSTEFVVTLNEGWNLFSTPVRLNTSYAQFNTIFDADSLQNISVILGWDGTQWYIPGQGTVFEPLQAYFIKVKNGMSASAVIIPSDSISVPPSRQITQGINLIGPAPAFTSENCIGGACSDGIGFSAMPIDQALVSVNQTPGGIGYTIVISPSLNQPGWAYARGGQSRDLLPFKGYWVILENGPDTLYGFSATPIQ